MHTSTHTVIRHTLYRDGFYNLNIRVPEKAQGQYGKLIRCRLSDDPEVAQNLTNQLVPLLRGSFDTGCLLNYKAIIENLKPRLLRYSDLMEEYVEIRRINPKLHDLAARELFSVAGDKEVASYKREDARMMVGQLHARGVMTATIRKRINSICAVLNYAYAELDIEKRNPFSRVVISGEGLDVKRRGTFTIDQLREGYEETLASKSTVRLLFPILGETGCRIGEIVGLRLEDVDLDQGVIHIRPHPHRRLKTAGSERSLPLLGYAEKAMREALRGSDGMFVFPRYCRPSGFVPTHASNALNKWIKARFGGLTAHCLRHTMRDRLRAVEAPLEMIDQVGGWSSVNTMGSKYGRGYEVDQLTTWMDRVTLK
ncbi:site-specific integrase [Marivivens donghaensis]|uniref:site-specific integrase n=1 Tax=Marivivens donghaensis TaxID=1699413 RepID=UPI00201EAEF2|nr:tyrosine-type recombinase/integrase [Marivivens donghaensis]MCL7408455.1 tyrosine-type recombinase/integrase [Marivivens donghaensis]MDN3704774.1 tyrosine-type recombinase/integrase [Marivivens donghaensis]